MDNISTVAVECRSYFLTHQEGAPREDDSRGPYLTRVEDEGESKKVLLCCIQPPPEVSWE